MSSNFHLVIHTLSLWNFLKRLRLRLSLKETRIQFLHLESTDKQLLGLICAKIRSFRMPEPYKGKGICSRVRLFAESLVSQLQLSNFN